MWVRLILNGWHKDEEFDSWVVRRGTIDAAIWPPMKLQFPPPEGMIAKKDTEPMRVTFRYTGKRSVPEGYPVFKADE
jgi:hypothetical protein